MKICWDNLEGIHLTRNGTFAKGPATYVYKEACVKCGESYLTKKSNQSNFCSFPCANKGRVHSVETRKNMSVARTGKTHSVETRKKISAAHVGKTISIETRRKMSASQIGKVRSIETKKRISVAQAGRTWHMSIEAKKKMSERMSKCVGILSHNYKGGVKALGLTTYDTHKDTLGLYEDIRKQEGTEILEVKCAYCGRWFAPTRLAVSGRLDAINNLNRGEGRLYCSENCKQSCPTYGQKKYPKNHKPRKTNNSIWYTDYELRIWREEVLKRADYKCEYCGKKATIAHHSKPKKLEPFFALDPEYGIACCEKCHYKYGHNGECGTGYLARIDCK